MSCSRGRLRVSRVVAVAVAGLAVVAVGAGCGGGGSRDGLEPGTARFTWGERSATVALDECGREGDVVVMAGAAHGLVVQVGADLSDGGAARTGVTGDMGADDGIWGAFGDELDEGPAGEITRVAADGDRLVVEGRWARLDDNLRPDPTQTLVAGKLTARCPAPDNTS